MKFGDKCEYFHHLCLVFHAELECMYLLQNFGLHLSEINAETSEHANKVLKGILVHLKGFANLAVTIYQCDNVVSNTVLNHLGFVIQKHMLKFSYVYRIIFFAHSTLPYKF